MATSSQQPEPLRLDQIELSGATRFGQPVNRAILILANGRRVSIDLPEPQIETDVLTLKLSEPEKTVVELFAKLGPGTYLKGVQIARMTEGEYDTIRKHLATLTSRGILENSKADGGYAQGRNFPSVPVVQRSLENER